MFTQIIALILTERNIEHRNKKTKCSKQQRISSHGVEGASEPVRSGVLNVSLQTE